MQHLCTKYFNSLLSVHKSTIFYIIPSSRHTLLPVSYSLPSDSHTRPDVIFSLLITLTLQRVSHKPDTNFIKTASVSITLGALAIDYHCTSDYEWYASNSNANSNPQLPYFPFTQTMLKAAYCLSSASAYKHLYIQNRKWNTTNHNPNHTGNGNYRTATALMTLLTITLVSCLWWI